MAISRAELEAMDRDELVDAIVGLSQTVDDLTTTVATLQEELEAEREARRDGDHAAAQDRAGIKRDVAALREDLGGEVSAAEDRLHRERSKLARRVSALEDELGVQPNQAVAIAEAGQDGAHLSKLGRLIRHGPDAATDNPTVTAHRAKAIVDNWDRWESTQADRDRGIRIRRLASREHDLKSRLEDVRDESLSWKQIYRAMELIADWSDGSVALKEGTRGKYVLVIQEEIDDA